MEPLPHLSSSWEWYKKIERLRWEQALRTALRVVSKKDGGIPHVADACALEPCV
jgi:hypothetical protein